MNNSNIYLVISRFTLFFLLFFSLDIYAQLKLKSIEPLSIISNENKRTRGNPRILLKNLSGTGTDFLQKNSNLVSQISSDETIILATDKIIVSTNYHADSRSITIKNYKIFNGIVEENGSMEFNDDMTFIPFSNGDFVAINAGESGGKDIRFYSKDFALIKTYIPFEEGYEGGIDFESYNDLLLLGVTSMQNSLHPKVILLNSRGQILFNINPSVNEEIPSPALQCAENFFGVYSFSSGSSLHQVTLLDKHGRQLWKKTIDGPPQSWKIDENTSNLIVGTPRSMFLFDLKEGRLLDQINLKDIYSDAGVAKLRGDGFLEINGIEIVNGFINVLLSEPFGLSNDYRNLILYSSNGNFKNQKQIIQVGNSKTLPLLKKIDKTTMIINDKEILKYD